MLFVYHIPESPRVPESHVPRPTSPSPTSPSPSPTSPSHVPVPLLVTAVHSERILAVSSEIWQRGSSIKRTESTPKDLRGFPKRFPKKYSKQFLKRFPMHFPPRKHCGDFSTSDSNSRGMFSKQGGKRRRFPNFSLQNHEENRMVPKSSSTKQNDSDANHRKKLFS